ncbi:MAG: hypothetical protein J6333_11270, partial [Planctomycetes bacterium]|nr:hypothetical protein [Planctomycetota bacterium]
MAAALWALAAPLALAGWPLPDLLRDAKGGKITTRAAFEADQKRKLDIVLREVYGFAPGRPQSTAYKVVEKNPAAMGGAATLKQVDIVMKNDGRSHTMRLVLFTPNKGKKPAPTFLLICNRGRQNIDPTRANKSEFWPAEEAIARGYGIAAFYVGDVDPDDKKDQFKDGVHALMDKTRDASSWGTLAAWAWGASRCMDYFEKDADVDAKRVAVIGHSRGGKAALCAGATDKRFALTVSSCSGCGGAKSFKRNSGQTIKDITTQFPHWFCGNFKKYVDNVQAMEFDQHFLTGAICPRAVYHGSASNDGGADPYGEYLTLVEADRAYQLYGLGGIGNAKEFPEKDQPRHAKNMAYHVRTGDHDLKKWDWEQYMNFADKVFFAGAPTAKISQPAAGAKLVSGEALTVRATATAVNGAIVRAELWVDGAFVRALARAPWAWGDDPACDRALRGLNVGNHTVKVVVFDERGQSATASQTVNVTAAGAATKVEAVEVIDAVSGEVRDVLREGAVVCPALWGGAVNLRAVTNGPVKSVKFRVNDQPVMVTNDAAAFTIAAKGQGWAAPAGKVYLQAIPFSQAWGQGLSGEEFAVSFTVNEASALAVGALTLVDATSGRDLFPLADGQTVNLAATGKKLSLRADALYGTASVQFFLDGQFVRTENVKPFTIMGDDNYGKYYAWTPALGERVVKVLPYSQNTAFIGRTFDWLSRILSIGAIGYIIYLFVTHIHPMFA